ncbi:MAG: hypothetical protein K2Z80_18095 [Xanthobacteraceae bacterium]|nr:hypothetical protein [Xanthobacteraceae bacterium]
MHELVIDRFLSTLRQTQLMPPDQILAYQRGLLEQLLRHARKHVPFYRDTGRLNPLFRTDDTIDWGRWNEVPILTRAEVQAAGSAMHSEDLPASHGRTWIRTTSGSTGEPVKVHHSQLSGKLGWTAIMARDFERHGIDPTQRLVFVGLFAPEDLGASRVRRHQAWFPGFADLGFHGERYDLTPTDSPSRLIETISALRPAYLRIPPIAVELMCAHDPERRLGKLGIAAVLTVGEHLSRSAQSRIENHFGCPVIQFYSSNECGQIASTCPYCGRFHVHSEVVFVEILGDDDAPTRCGETGWVVVTRLYNYVMPLIRYDHADQAVVGAAGACRITLPALDAVYGKERDSFEFPGDIVVIPQIPTEFVAKWLGASAYQVAQTANNRCEFRIVPGTLPPSEMQFDQMTALLRSMWWAGLQVDYRIVDDLPRKFPRAKLPIFVREVPAGQAVEQIQQPLASAPDATAVTDEIKARYLNTLEQTERMPRPQLVRYQAGLAADLVRDACAKSTFYADRLQPVYTDGAFKPENWEQIPILTRAELQSDIAHIVGLEDEHPGWVAESSTSGSTGTPLTLRWTFLAAVSTQGMMERLFRWHALDPNARHARIRVVKRAEAPWPEGLATGRWSIDGPGGTSFVLDIATPIAQQIDWLRRIRPQYLSTNPTNLEALATELGASGRDLGLKAAITVGEVLKPETRLRVTEMLGAKVIDTYGCQELGKVALECPQTGLMHVCAENMIVEVVDELGHPVRPGETGRVVLTGFYNRATPFIRYAIGDYAETAPGPCPCGRTLPALKRVLGRQRNMFVLPDNSKIWPRTAIVTNLSDLLPLKQFQMIQTAPDRIELRYVPTDPSHRPDIEAVRARLRASLHPAIDVVLNPVSNIPRGPSGKFEDFVCRVAMGPQP